MIIIQKLSQIGPLNQQLLKCNTFIFKYVYTMFLEVKLFCALFIRI